MREVTTGKGLTRYVCPRCNVSHAFKAQAEGCCRSISGEAGKTTGIEATLAERGNRYGEFPEHARITQNLKRAMADSPNWPTLPDAMKESLEMVAHKVGRILNGDPTYHDSWHDIIGYTKLVADPLAGED